MVVCAFRDDDLIQHLEDDLRKKRKPLMVHLPNEYADYRLVNLSVSLPITAIIANQFVELNLPAQTPLHLFATNHIETWYYIVQKNTTLNRYDCTCGKSDCDHINEMNTTMPLPLTEVLA